MWLLAANHIDPPAGTSKRTTWTKLDSLEGVSGESAGNVNDSSYDQGSHCQVVEYLGVAFGLNSNGKHALHGGGFWQVH